MNRGWIADAQTIPSNHSQVFFEEYTDHTTWLETVMSWKKPFDKTVRDEYGC